MIICEFEDGGKGKLRHVTCNAIVVKDGKILLGKRGTYNGGKPLSEAGKWALFGGFLGRDESVEEALKREVKEESGWLIQNFRLLHIKDNPDRKAEDRQNVEFIFVADAIEQVTNADEEVSAVQWFALDNLPPEKTIAFDHADDLELYKRYLVKPFQLPVLGKIQR